MTKSIQLWWMNFDPGKPGSKRDYGMYPDPAYSCIIFAGSAGWGVRIL
jgi:hypothetical protein